MFFPVSGYWARVGEGLPRDWYTNCFFFPPWAAPNPSFQNFFFDTMITENDHPRYVKHVLGHIPVFFTVFGYWVHGGRGSVKGLVRNEIMQFFTLGGSKIKGFETYF